MAAKRKIKQNIWGNWRGYLGTRCVEEFGEDEIVAGYWLLTGDKTFNAGYADKNIDAARNAARSS